MSGLSYFGNESILEPHCPGCKTKVDYGISTTYDEKLDAHKCNTCGHLI